MTTSTNLKSLTAYKSFQKTKEFFKGKSVAILYNSKNLLSFKRDYAVADKHANAVYDTLALLGAKPYFMSSNPDKNIKPYSTAATINTRQITQEEFNKIDAVVVMAGFDCWNFYGGAITYEQCRNLELLSKYDKHENVFYEFCDPAWRPIITKKHIDKVITLKASFSAAENTSPTAIDADALLNGVQYHKILMPVSIDTVEDPRNFLIDSEEAKMTRATSNFKELYVDRDYLVFPDSDLYSYSYFNGGLPLTVKRNFIYHYVSSNLLLKSKKRMSITKDFIEHMYDSRRKTLLIGQEITDKTTKFCSRVPQSEMKAILLSCFSTIEIGDAPHNNKQIKVHIVEALNSGVIPFVWHEYDQHGRLFNGKAKFLYVSSPEEANEKISQLMKSRELYEQVYTEAIEGFSEMRDKFFSYF